MITIVDGPPLTTEQKDECARKGILINAILSYLKDEVHKHNAEMQKYHLPGEYRTFCYGTEFLRLVFLDDADIEMIATKILG